MSTVLPPTRYRRATAILASEWIKLRSVRSLPSVLLAAALFCLTLAALVCSNYQARWSHLSAQQRLEFNPTDTSLGNLQLSVLFFGVLGCLVVTSEYGRGLIRVTLAATPQRAVVLAAKATLFGVLGWLANTAICLLTFLTGQSLLTRPAPHASLGDPGVLQAVLGAGTYLSLVGLFGLFLGVLLRSTAATISAVTGVFLVLPVLVNSLPRTPTWQHTVPYLPADAGIGMWHSKIEYLLTSWQGTGVLTLYVTGLGIAAFLRIRWWDA